MAATPAPKNIYVVGAQSTGKTTLVNELQNHLPFIAQGLSIEEPRIISEVARTVLKKHPIETEAIRSDPQQSLKLQELILAAQVCAEEDALTRGSWFISDRSGFDPLVYARRYVGQEAAEKMMMSADWLELKDRMVESVIVVCETGVPWLRDDGVRLMPKHGEDWTEFHQLFCQMLKESGLPYHILPSGIADLSKRTDFVLSLWKYAVASGERQASRI